MFFFSLFACLSFLFSYLFSIKFGSLPYFHRMLKAMSNSIFGGGSTKIQLVPVPYETNAHWTLRIPCIMCKKKRNAYFIHKQFERWHNISGPWKRLPHISLLTRCWAIVVYLPRYLHNVQWWWENIFHHLIYFTIIVHTFSLNFAFVLFEIWCKQSKCIYIIMK